MRRLLASAALLASLLAACETTPELTPTQWEAIETRRVDGKRDQVLRAASAVVLDDGYYFAASDFAAGTLTAAKVPSTQQDAFQRSGGMTGHSPIDMISIWVVQADPVSCSLRVQYRDFGTHISSPERVSAFWTAVQRRMLKDQAGGAP
ncbi:MAG: hypothetical protein JSS51_15365 [Planctomycetes bacterium]|nr:hypothetical protein [Planctomycetota bacterium]